MGTGSKNDRAKTKSDYIMDWNRKHKKSKTICWRVDYSKNLQEMYLFCFRSAAIIALYRIFYLVD